MSSDLAYMGRMGRRDRCMGSVLTEYMRSTSSGMLNASTSAQPMRQHRRRNSETQAPYVSVGFGDLKFSAQ